MPEISAFLKVVDAELRNASGYKRKLTVSDPTGDFTRAVREVLNDWDEARRKAANPVRQLDFGRLAGIRADALETQEKLIVEEPFEEALPCVEGAAQAALKEESLEKNPANSEMLASEDRKLLQRLLDGIRPTELPGGLSPEMTADRLNEKLYDAFGDAILEVVGGKLVLIEDYAEDLRELLQDS